MPKAYISKDGTYQNSPRPVFCWDDKHTDTYAMQKREPWRSSRLFPRGYEIPMAWHHMVPWPILRDGWSAIAILNRWDVVRAWLESLEVPETSITQCVEGMSSQTYRDDDDLSEKVCWAKWNLVEGPKGDVRSDDPKDGNALDRFDYGAMPDGLRGRASIAAEIDAALRRIKGLYENRDTAAASISPICRRLSYLFRRLAGQNNISMFDIRAWVKTDNGKFTTEQVEANRKNDQKIILLCDQDHPKWAKNTGLPVVRL